MKALTLILVAISVALSGCLGGGGGSSSSAGPSAEVRGHGSGPKPDQPPVPEDISVIGAEPVGRYAVRIRFSDGHDSGLYTWKFLRELISGA